MNDLSIIIVNYNTKDLTKECISSVIGAGLKIKYEIIVIDNGSDDGSSAVFNILQKKIKNLILIKNDKNLGFAKANNQGIKISKGKYVLLLNSDTKLIKGSVEKLLNFAERTSDAGVIAPRLLNPDGSVQGSVFRFPTVWMAIKQYWLKKGEILDKYYPEGIAPISVESVVMAAFLLTPEARESVGFLDERYFMFYEDFDYCRRLWKAGLKIYYLPEALVIHYHGKSGKNLADEANQWRRLIPSSKIYHGLIKHYLINFVIWSGQKCQKFLKS